MLGQKIMVKFHFSSIIESGQKAYRLGGNGHKRVWPHLVKCLGLEEKVEKIIRNVETSTFMRRGLPSVVHRAINN